MKRAALLIAAAVAVIAACGWLLSAAWHLTYGHGLYCAIGVASTVGCDAEPRSGAGRLVAVVVILVTVPTLAAVFAWLTGHHAGSKAAAKVHEQVKAAEKRIAEEADKRHVIMQRHIERVVSGHCADVMHHVSVVADGPAKGGAGSNPAGAGLNAEGPVVPPPATAERIQPVKVKPRSAGRKPPREPGGM